MAAVSKEDIQIIVTEIHHMGREIHEMCNLMQRLVEHTLYPRQYYREERVDPNHIRMWADDIFNAPAENKPVGWDK